MFETSILSSILLIQLQNSQIYISLSLINFHKIQTSKIHSFPIKSWNEEFLMSKYSQQRKKPNKVHIAFSFSEYVSNFSLFHISQFISSSHFNQTHLNFNIQITNANHRSKQALNGNIIQLLDYKTSFSCTLLVISRISSLKISF